MVPRGVCVSRRGFGIAINPGSVSDRVQGVSTSSLDVHYFEERMELIRRDRMFIKTISYIESLAAMS